MGRKTFVLETAYECESCHKAVDAASFDTQDKPTGYYVHMRRVTAARVHNISEELYLCSKDCLIQYVTYGISHSTVRVEPIGDERRWDRRTGRWER